MEEEEAPTKKLRLNSDSEEAKICADSETAEESIPAEESSKTEESSKKVACAKSISFSKLDESNMQQAQKIASIMMDQKQLAILKDLEQREKVLAAKEKLLEDA